MDVIISSRRRRALQSLVFLSQWFALTNSGLSINVAGGTMGGRDEREGNWFEGLAGWAHGGMLGGSTNGQGRDTALG